MADEDIDVRVRLRGARKAAAEAHQVARGIDDIGDEARQADTRIGSVGGVAKMATPNLLRLGEAATEAAGGGGGAGGGIEGLRTSFGGLSGSVGTTLPLLAVGAAVVGALTVALVALAASATLAVAGLAALGVAAGGALLVGFGFAAVAAKRFEQQSEIAGTAAYELRRAAGRTGATLMRAFGPGVDAALRGLAGALRTIRPLLENMRTPIQVLGRAFGSAFGIIADTLASPAVQAALGQFIIGVGQLAGPAAQIASTLGVAFLNLANVALPVLIPLLQQAAAWLQRMFGGKEGQARMQRFVTMIIPHLKAWAFLGLQIARVFIGLLRAAAPWGLMLVRWLGEVAQKMANWLNSKEGQARMREFFRQVIPLAKQILIFIGRLVLIFFQLVQAAAPALTAIFWALNKVLQVVGWVLEKFRHWANIGQLIWNAATKTHVFADAWDAVKRAFWAAYDFIAPKIQWIIDRFNDAIGLAGKIPGNPLGVAGDAGGIGPGIANLFPHRQHGGPVFPGSSYLVGEAGPEVVTMGHGRGMVHPIAPSGRAVNAAVGGGGDIVIPATFVLADGSVLARTTARAVRKADNAK